MAAQKTLVRCTLIGNNTPIYYVPDSIKFTEGKGGQNVRTQTAGGGLTQIVISENLETNYSTLEFALYPTEENIAIARQWKSNPGKNAFQLIQDGFSRTMGDATIVNDYEVELGSDTVITLEIMGAPLV